MSRGSSRDSGALLTLAAGAALALWLASRRSSESVAESLPIEFQDDSAGWPDDMGSIVEYVTGQAADVASYTPPAFVAPDHVQPSEGASVNPLSIVRGLRNNNPGNIRLGQPWQGLRETQTDGAFAQFISMEYGIRALCKVLFTYAEKHGLRNIAGIISRWAPPQDKNDTPAYINFVSQQLGVDPLAQINVRDPETLFRLARAIIRKENGYLPSLGVSDAAVRGGIQLALSS